MPEHLFDLFSALYYCPTALRLPSLDYKDKQGQTVKMSVVGDPTTHGPMINDGTPSGKPSQS